MQHGTRAEVCLAAALGIWVSTNSFVADAQEPSAPGASSIGPPTKLESIEVTAQREVLRKSLTTFVSNVTIADGSNTARWRTSLCPSVVGTAPDQGEFVKARIREVATFAGAPVGDSATCAANLLIFLTTQPDELVAQLKARYPKLFDNMTTDEITGAVPTAHAVRIWQRYGLRNADGSQPGVTYRLKDSRILSSVAEELDAVIIVVDSASTGTVTFGQLSDYIAMVGLAQVDLRADLEGASTILRLFAGDGKENIPGQLTDWDRAFLKAVYGMQDSHLREPSVVANRMLEQLEAQK
jgi:hypothetical protein